MRFYDLQLVLGVLGFLEDLAAGYGRKSVSWYKESEHVRDFLLRLWAYGCKELVVYHGAGVFPEWRGSKAIDHQFPRSKFTNTGSYQLYFRSMIIYNTNIDPSYSKHFRIGAPMDRKIVSLKSCLKKVSEKFPESQPCHLPSISDGSVQKLIKSGISPSLALKSEVRRVKLVHQKNVHFIKASNDRLIKFDEMHGLFLDALKDNSVRRGVGGGCLPYDDLYARFRERFCTQGCSCSRKSCSENGHARVFVFMFRPCFRKENMIFWALEFESKSIKKLMKI